MSAAGDETRAARPNPSTRARLAASVVLSACVAGALVAAADAAGRGQSLVELVRTAAIAFGLGAAAGLLLSAIELPIVLATERRARHVWSRVATEERLTSLRATFIAFPIALGILLVGLRLALVSFRSVQDQRLLENLTLAAAAGLACVAGLVFVGLLGLGRRMFGALRARGSWRWLWRPAVQRFVLLVLPLAALGVAGLVLFGQALGPFAVVFWLALVIAVQLALLPLLVRATSRRPKLGLAITIAASIAALLGAERAVARSSDSARSIQVTGAALFVQFAQSATDFDGDGVSSIFGARDCAPFDRNRSPWARDLPANGIDEDCDGKDATDAGKTWPGEDGPRYWDGLGRERIKQYDIVLFVVDALRADHASFAGYAKPTTPHLDVLAKESIVFTRALSHSSATLFSIPSIFTGIDPGRLKWERGRGLLQVSDEHETIAERLKQAGYVTGFVVSRYFNQVMPGLFQGFDWLEQLDQNQRRSSPSSAALAISLIERARQENKPFFLTVYMPAPHSPYVFQEPGYPSFGKGTLAAYDSEIAAVDRHIGFVLDALREDRKRFPRTIVIVASDHGEEFGEHGGKDHARTCHIESLEVPILLRVPGLEPARVERRVGLTGIVPTLIELVGLPRPPDPSIDGHSLLLEAYAPERIPQDHPLYCSVRSQVQKQGHFYRRSVRSGKWALMQELTGGGGVQLFDMERDPGEKAPLPLEGEALRVARELESQLNRAMTGNLAQLSLTRD